MCRRKRREGESKECVRFEVFTAVTLKNVISWNMTSCDSCKNNVSEKRIASIIKVTCDRVFLRRVLQLIATANVVPSSLILVTLIMEALRSSESSALTTSTRRNITDDGVPKLHLDLPSGFFPSVFPTSVLHAFFFSAFVLHVLPT
jgi:hypothetical protein